MVCVTEIYGVKIEHEIVLHGHPCLKLTVHSKCGLFEKVIQFASDTEPRRIYGYKELQDILDRARKELAAEVNWQEDLQDKLAALK
ncbi:MAG: hypothetical protein ACE145_18320 [Terriglobia bacterium]